jgi:hypothetical protein
MCADLAHRPAPRVSLAIDALSLSSAGALASTFPVLDAAAATCLTRKMMLRPLEMLAVVQDLARAAFLHATTSAADVSGADPNFLRPTTLHGHAARSSRTKTFPVTSTASFCSSAFNFVGFRVTRGTLARALVTPAELAIDNAKEAAWMEMYDHDRDTLEDILYRRLQDLWAQGSSSTRSEAGLPRAPREAIHALRGRSFTRSIHVLTGRLSTRSEGGLPRLPRVPREVIHALRGR